MQFLTDPLGDRRAVRRDDHHHDGQALLRVRPSLQLAELERFGVVVAVPFLLVSLGPLPLVGLELLYPVHSSSFTREMDGHRTTSGTQAEQSNQPHKKTQCSLCECLMLSLSLRIGIAWLPTRLLQIIFFEKTWKYDVLDNVSGLVDFLSSMKKKKNSYNYDSIIKDVDQIKILYRDMTNKFLDTWLLAKLFVAENETNMNVSVMYLGSLHSLHMESYFKDVGYILVDFFENKGLLSCINIDK